MTGLTATRPRVLLVGPYERDHAGDLLRLLVVERHLQHCDVVTAAPVATHSALLDRPIPASGPHLSSETFDAVWSVGGLVDTPVRRRRPWPGRDDQARVSPYIPAGIALRGTPMRVIHSAGLWRAYEFEPRELRPLIKVLEAQDVIAVRDELSGRLLERHGIAYDLVPDPLHALSVLEPAPRNPDTDLAVLQLSSDSLARAGREAVAAAVAASSILQSLRVRLLAIGEESAADYEDLCARITQLRPGTDIGIAPERRPLEVAACIRGARIVVSTSPDVRIVAAAYAIPRVSLSRPDTDRYARTWDPRMPAEAIILDIDRKIERALRVGSRPGDTERCAALSRRASEGIAAIARDAVPV